MQIRPTKSQIPIENENRRPNGRLFFYEKHVLMTYFVDFMYNCIKFEYSTTACNCGDTAVITGNRVRTCRTFLQAKI
jgi:hypothetical protein